MQYFPTEEGWTQVMLPPKSVLYHKPMEQLSTDHRPTLCQTNLPFNSNPPFEYRRSHGRPTHSMPSYINRPRPCTFTPMGSNSIPPPQRWRIKNSQPTTQNPMPPELPLTSTAPTTPTCITTNPSPPTSSSSNSNIWTPMPPNV